MNLYEISGFSESGWWIWTMIIEEEGRERERDGSRVYEAKKHLFKKYLKKKLFLGMKYFHLPIYNNFFASFFSSMYEIVIYYISL